MKKIVKYLKVVLLIGGIMSLIYMAIIYNSVGLMIVSAFIPLFLVIENIILHRQMKRIVIKTDADTLLPVLQETVTLSISCMNPTKFPILAITVNGYLLEEGQKETFSFTGNIAALKKMCANVKITPNHCQIAEIALDEIQLHGWMGFGKKRKQMAGNQYQIFVYPKWQYTDISKLPQGSIEETEEIEPDMTYYKAITSYEPEGVRQYQPGDRLQQINWKMSAKYDELYVKEYASYVSCSYKIHMDGKKLCLANAKERDQLYQKMLSISMSLLEHQKNHYVIYELWQEQQSNAGFAQQQKLVVKKEDAYDILRELYESVRAYEHCNMPETKSSMDKFAETQQWIEI